MSNTNPTDQRTQFTEGLRQIADFLNAHPEVPLPTLTSAETGQLEPTMEIYLNLSVRDDQKLALADVARAMGRADKHASDTRMRVFRRFAGIALVAVASRDEVCERVVTGTREIEVEEQDAEALAAVPTRKVTKVEEIVEWRCTPLLAAGADEPAEAEVGAR